MIFLTHWGNPLRNVCQGGGAIPAFRGGDEELSLGTILSRETVTKNLRAGNPRTGASGEQDVEHENTGWRWAWQPTASIKGENSMVVRVLVMSDRPDEYTGKRGLVKQQIITVMDLSETGERLAQPIEYALSDEEKPVHAGKLQDKVINLGIRELLPFGGRLRARGKIVSLVGKQ
jgi:hypothetical protein